MPKPCVSIYAIDNYGCHWQATIYWEVDMSRHQVARKDYHLIPDQVRPDYSCYAQQGDVHTSCGRVVRVTRVVNAWDFVSCPDCKINRAVKAMRRNGISSRLGTKNALFD